MNYIKGDSFSFFNLKNEKTIKGFINYSIRPYYIGFFICIFKENKNDFYSLIHLNSKNWIVKENSKLILIEKTIFKNERLG
jgi:hypothetical protein